MSMPKDGDGDELRLGEALHQYLWEETTPSPPYIHYNLLSGRQKSQHLPRLRGLSGEEEANAKLKSEDTHRRKTVRREPPCFRDHADDVQASM